METPPRPATPSTKTKLRLKSENPLGMKSGSEDFFSENCDLERFDDSPVHTGEIQPLDDDFDDEDLE
uniref:AlNc14C76G5112 protein n=1 Tax=Albugo laibachii Nc14 TaxID=890382 RepID=F0WER2_9STRA|nr:AlNc14C76G5112 [Albugo laibachii Nc14]|eukprot:CCA19694.1 AlNc14C76G5112 [Albugo laibachii Nc14]